MKNTMKSLKEIKTEMKKAEFLIKFSGSLIGFINSLWTGYATSYTSKKL